MAEFSIDFSEVDDLSQIINDYGDKGLKVINEVLHTDAGPIISDNIKLLLPESGRNWKRKKPAASQAEPFKSDTSEMLAITIKTKNAYDYLYFPDDGSNTKRHAGNKQFMQRGAENSTQKIIDLCLGKLTD